MTIENPGPAQFNGNAIGAAAIFANTAPASSPSTVAERLNLLLRNEIRAVENYAALVKQISPGTLADILLQQQNEHTHHCKLLRDRIVELGGEPDDSSGARGVLSHAMHDTINRIGGESAGIWALHESENFLLTDYTTTINEVDSATAELIANHLVPIQQKQVAALEQILNASK